ncbi:MAG: acyl-CoA dehydratase activase [Candidatus Aegiribacteria sp.]
MINCGIDIGARSIEVVLYDGAEVVETLVTDTGNSPIENGRRAFCSILATAGISREDLAGVTSTGYGRNYFSDADSSCSEIICHARGVSYFFPDAGTVIDIGGQDSKLIELNEDGRPVDFVMNDRCAAGTGRFIEMAGGILGIPVSKMNGSVDPDAGSVDISSMCAVFAESEIIGLLQSGSSADVILNGIFQSVASRTLSMAGRARVRERLVFTGGVAQLEGVRNALREETGIEIESPPDPRITGALGAAIIASESTGGKRQSLPR